MSDFGDFDPEDAYDVDDPIPVRLSVLERVVESIRDDADRREVRRVDALRVVDNFGELHGADRRRLAEIRDVLEELA